jgi:uncharacterized protein YcaQ
VTFVPATGRRSPQPPATLKLLAVPLTIDRPTARRFLVRRHLLAPARTLPARKASVLKVIERLGVLQFDPLEVPGARNHDLVLHARIKGYRREWCEDWLYGPERRLIELYNKSLNIVPMGELPHYRITWQRNAERYADGILREQAQVAEAIVGRIAAEGPLSTAAFAEHSHAVDWWWAPTRVSRAVLEALFVTGQVGIARRDGNRRFYDLIERIVPADLLALRESEEDAMRHRLMSRYQATGLASRASQAEVMHSAGSGPERTRLTADLVEAGRLLAVEVEGLKGERYIPADEQPILDLAAESSPQASPTVAFIAPLDPLAWDRRLLRDLWDFDYVWEVYVPEAKRRWGYYVLPILFGDRLVGRFEPRVDRAAGTLRVLGIWWERGFSPRRADGFVPAMRQALADYLGFVGAGYVDWTPVTGSSGRTFGSIGPQAAIACARSISDRCERSFDA